MWIQELYFSLFIYFGAVLLILSILKTLMEDKEFSMITPHLSTKYYIQSIERICFRKLIISMTSDSAQNCNTLMVDE